MYKKISDRNVKICKLVKNGCSVKSISSRFNISGKTVYSILKKNDTVVPRALKRLTKKRKVLNKWMNKIFPDIKKMSLKYKKILSMKGFNIDQGDIESTLLDLMIHTNQKDIKNKDAYFRKYCPLKISNLRDKIIKRSCCSLFDKHGEEKFSGGMNPELAYIANEESTG